MGEFPPKDYSFEDTLHRLGLAIYAWDDPYYLVQIAPADPQKLCVALRKNEYDESAISQLKKELETHSG